MEDDLVKFIRAKTQDDFSHAHQLIEDMYGWRGYQVSKLEQDDDSGTFIVKLSDSVLGTFTIYYGEKLPSSHYPEVQTLIKNGHIICEVGRLAIFQSTLNTQKFTALLFSIVYVFTQSVDADRVVMEVNPRHEIYYQRMLGFETIRHGHCERVDAESVLMSLDVSYATDSILIKKPKTLYRSFPDYVLLERLIPNILQATQVPLQI